MKKIIILFTVLIYGLNINNCSSPNKDSDYGNYPSVTGIYVTTIEAMYGTGEVYGTPSYTIGDSSISLNLVNIVPNPYLGRHILEPSKDKKFIILYNLPDTVTIEISVGRFQDDITTIDTRMINQNNPIRTIIKNDSSVSYLQWDLKDDNGQYIATGFYSLNFFDTIGNTHRIDAYIILHDGISRCSDWNDPTGWLPEDWRYIQISNKYIDVCSESNMY